MWFLKYMLLVGGVGMFVIAVAIVANDMWLVVNYRRRAAIRAIAIEPQPVRWRTSVALAFLAWAPLLIAFSLLVMIGTSGARVSQPRITVADTVDPGGHAPSVEKLELFTRNNHQHNVFENIVGD